MKTTGVVRRIDELGRIVIPKEIRRNLGIRDGENLEILTDENSIILKKHSRLANILEIVEKFSSLAEDIMNYSIIVTDREKIIYSAIEFNENYKNLSIPSVLINLIDNRETLVTDVETRILFENKELKGYFSIVPIISSNDSIGLIILYSKYKINDVEIKFSKLFAKLVGEKIDIA